MVTYGKQLPCWFIPRRLVRSAPVADEPFPDPVLRYKPFLHIRVVPAYLYNRLLVFRGKDDQPAGSVPEGPVGKVFRSQIFPTGDMSGNGRL